MIAPNPDCTAKKHRACDGRGLDHDTDELGPCSCVCHRTAELARRFRTEIGGAYIVVAAALERDHVGVIQHGGES